MSVSFVKDDLYVALGRNKFVFVEQEKSSVYGKWHRKCPLYCLLCAPFTRTGRLKNELLDVYKKRGKAFLFQLSVQRRF